jgi:hypothetical protein
MASTMLGLTASTKPAKPASKFGPGLVFVAGAVLLILAILAVSMF